MMIMRPWSDGGSSVPLTVSAVGLHRAKRTCTLFIFTDLCATQCEYLGCV